MADDLVVRRLAEHFANPNDDGSEGEAGDENHAVLARAYLAVAAERDGLSARLDVQRDLLGNANENIYGLNRDIKSLQAQIAHKVEWRKEVEAQLAAMTAERDEARGLLGIAGAERNSWYEKFTASKAARERLKRAVEYGGHEDNCKTFGPGYRDICDCDCGLAEALTSPAKEPEPSDGFWAVCYLHDWDPPDPSRENTGSNINSVGGPVYPEVHALYRTMREADAVIRKMGNPSKYWAVRVRWGTDVPKEPEPSAEAGKEEK